MDTYAIMAGTIAAGMAGLGLRLGARLVPLTVQAYRDLRTHERGGEARLRRLVAEQNAAHRGLAHPEGRRRDSAIVGVYEDCLRNTDGSYTWLYNLELEPTMLGDDNRVERRCDDVARTLCAEMPVGTMVQLRYRTARDPGLVIAEHLRERRYENIHAPAAQIHDLDLGHHHALAQRGYYRCEKASLAIRIPATHPADVQGNGVTEFMRAIMSEGVIRTLKSAPTHRALRGVIDRLAGHEAEACLSASAVRRRLELEFPLTLRQLAGAELFEAVYLAHNPSATTAPNVRIRPGDDLRDYFCLDPIEYRDGYVMHGDMPVSMVSMFVPPAGSVTADSMRLLTARADLAFPHTICVEYIALDPAKAKKQLVKRADKVEEETQKADGRARRDHDARKALSDAEQLLAHISTGRDALVHCRFYALVYGEPVKTRADEAESLKLLEQRTEAIESAIKRIEGADVRREDTASLHCLYQGTILGEMSPKPTGRELQEGALSLSALAPLESAWRGSAYPHSIFSTVSGRLVGYNGWDKSARSNIKSPLTLILSEPGGGKSTLAGMLSTDALATKPFCRVHAVDFDGSMAPLARALGARYFQLNPQDHKTINIFDSPELAAGEMPDEETVALILMDVSLLAGVKEHDERSPVVLTKCIKSVLKNFVPRNGPGKPKKEPTLKHLVEKLKAYQWENERDRECAEDLASKLESYVGDPWLDAPTSPEFDEWAPFDVYELGSLEKFPPLIRQTLAGRIATRVVRAIGRKNEDGEYSPTLLVFDEAHMYPAEFPGLMKVIGRGARRARKANVVTCVLTHTYDDFEGIHDITATAGVKVVGLQTGDFSRLARDARLSERAVSAIQAIRNRDGRYAQFVLVMGTGPSQQVEMVQVELSPIRLWIHTTNPEEHNARAKVMRLTGWSNLEAVTWLAERYPRGLVCDGLLDIDDALLKPYLKNQE
jgi:hypothetical protein